MSVFYIYLYSHFVTVAIDNVHQLIKGYDSMHGYPGTPMPLIIANIKRFILELVPTEKCPPTFDHWPVIPDAAQQEGLPRHITGDCCRYAFLIGSCVTVPSPIPICLLTPEVLAASRPTLMYWLYHRHVPSISSFYSPTVSPTVVTIDVQDS